MGKLSIEKVTCIRCGLKFYPTILGWKVKFCPYCGIKTDAGKGKEPEFKFPLRMTINDKLQKIGFTVVDEIVLHNQPVTVFINPANHIVYVGAHSVTIINDIDRKELEKLRIPELAQLKEILKEKKEEREEGK